MDVESGFRANTGSHGDTGFSKVIVEVFEPRTPLRSYCDFGPGPQHPAAAHTKRLVFTTREIGKLDEPGARPPEAAGAVDQPIVERAAEAAAQPSDVVDLFGKIASRGDREPHNVITAQKIGERKIAFGPQKNARVQHMVVAKLHAAEEASDRLVRVRRNRVCKAVTCVSAAIAQMSASVKSGPIQKQHRRQSFPWLPSSELL